MRWNLGCGAIKLKDYQNLDIKDDGSAYPLQIPPNSADEIRASHLLEHFSHRQVRDVLRNWVGKLKPGGLLKIAVPDFKLIAKKYTDGEQINVLGYVMGGHVDEHDRHQSLFDEESLRKLMEAVGLTKIERWKDEAGDCSGLPISLNLQGTKRFDIPESAEKSDAVRIAVVMSMPRLAFTDNMRSVFRGFKNTGAKLSFGQGVFWGQVLTRLIEEHMDDGTELLFTVDYDTWFRREHVQRLCQLMMEHPEADAIVPVQTMREHYHAMFGMRDGGDNVRVEIPHEEFQRPLTSISSGHFGLTVFRMTQFHGLPRPWFLPKPDPDGRWGPGRIEEDIGFWENWRQSGRTIFLANQVHIGHLQMMCTFSDTYKNQWRPIHVYMRELEKGELPEHCVPKIEVLQ